MKIWTQMTFIIVILLANAAYANSNLTNQMPSDFFRIFRFHLFSFLFIFAIISGILSVIKNKPGISLYGRKGTLIAILIIIFFSTFISLIRIRSNIPLIIGVLIVFFALLVLTILCFDSDKKERNDTVIPKISEPPQYHFSAKQVTNQTNKEPSSFAEVTEIQTKTPNSSIPSHNPATYEEIVGEIPSAKEIAGKIGEDAVSKAIWTACEYDKRYYKLLRNVYIPKLNGKYSEIDVLLLHETGVYVFESKNLSGTVYGDYKHPQWERYKKNGEKDFIVNPIKQNEGHINALCNYLQLNKYQLRAFNMVVFGSKAELKYIPENSSFNSIHEIYNLEMELIKKMTSQKNFYSQKTIDSWCSLLVPCMMIPKEEKQKHKEQVSQKYN